MPDSVYLVDASIYVFRAYYSIDTDMTAPDGKPVNAVYGYTQFLRQLLQKKTPYYIGVCFDSSVETSFRNSLYPPYKANREPAPEDLVEQFDWCREMTQVLGIPSYDSKQYEADDLIASLAHTARGQQKSVTIVSRDKDLLQAMQPGDHYWNFAENEIISYSQVKAKKGVGAEQIADLLALAGDAVDNIPGATGIGLKTASALLNKFGDLDTLFANLDQVAASGIRGAARIQSLLTKHREDVILYRQLTGLKQDMDGTENLSDLRRQPVQTAALTDLCQRLGFSDYIAKSLCETAAH